MSAEKTDAIVIRSVDFSETSSIVTFFSREFGKLATLAKGARRKKGPFESALDLLATCRIVFLHKSNDALDLLTEAKLVNRLRASEVDLHRLYAGYYFAELLQNLTDEMDPHPELYDFTLESLRLLEDGEVLYEPVVLRYELTVLRETGHLPSLRQCVGCGQGISSTGRVAFGLIAGGVLCPTCRAGHRRLVSLRHEVLSVINNFSDPKLDTWRNALEYREYEKEIRPLINSYLTHLLGKKMRLHRFLPILGKV